LLAAQQAASGAAEDKKSEDKKQADKNQALIKQGQGLLAQTETPGAAFLPAPPGHRPQAQMQPFVIPGAQQTPPDFMQILAQQRLMQGT
jgi:hypothetical protein